MRLLLLSVLLTGCSVSSSGDAPEDAFKFPEVSLSEDPSTVSVIPASLFMDDPPSPYPLAELEWKADMNGDGALLWPGTPEKSTVFVMWSREKQGGVLRQYVWAAAHLDGAGYQVTALSWEAGEPVVLSQYFDWGYDS